jgi:Subtilisin inhibitor-like
MANSKARLGANYAASEVMRLGSAFVAASLVLAAGCGGSSGTELTIEVGNALGSEQYELTCDPPGGTVPDPAGLCNLLDANADTMLTEVEPRVTCVGGMHTIGIHVEGTFRGDGIDDEVSSCAGNAEAERLWLTGLPAPQSRSR